ncbi:MAG: hypothetical protein ABIG94_02015 [Pseudomonadota bacterium]
METDSPICPIPSLGHCVGERCNFWDPERGCIGVGMCFDSEVQKESASTESIDPFADQIILSAYEDLD